MQPFLTPSNNNPQGLPGHNPMAAFPGMPSMTAVPPGSMPLNLPRSIPGPPASHSPQGGMSLPNGQQMTPQQMAQMMLQQMQKPGGAAGGSPGVQGPQETHDIFQEMVMPGGPEGFIAGGAAGCGSAFLLNQLFADRPGGSYLLRGAQRLDTLPVVRPVSNWLERVVVERLKNGSDWSKQLVTHLDPKVVQKLHLENIIHSRAGQLPDKTLKMLLSQATSSATLETRVTRLIKVAKDAKTRRVLDEILRGARSMENQFFGIYRDQHALLQTMGKEVGPIGRMYATSMLYLKRIMGGHTLHMAGTPATTAASSGILGKLGSWIQKGFGPFLSGAVIFGLAFGHAKKAEKGDKVKTFMHNLLGIGIGQFIGWEVGKRLLRFTMNTMAPKLANKHLLGMFARFAPFLGRLTWAGTVAEIGAMLLLSMPFQWVGEKVAHTFFGKPQSVRTEALKKEGIYPAKPLPPGETPGNRPQTFDTFRKHRETVRTQASEPDKKNDKAKTEEDPGTVYPDQHFSLTPEEIAPNLAGEREQKYIDDIMSSLGTHKGVHSIFDPQFPVEGLSSH